MNMNTVILLFTQDEKRASSSCPSSTFMFLPNIYNSICACQHSARINEHAQRSTLTGVHLNVYMHRRNGGGGCCVSVCTGESRSEREAVNAKVKEKHAKERKSGLCVM